MSSISFVEVEGRFGMPLPRSPAPSSYGREWALLAPDSELRAGVRALYTAIVRTACLDVDAFLASSRWDLERGSLPASTAFVAAARATPSRPAPPDAERAETARVAPVSAPNAARPLGGFKAPGRRVPRRYARGASRPSRRWASGVGIAGTVVLLAWIVIDRVPLHAPPHTQAPAVIVDRQAPATTPTHRGPVSGPLAIEPSNAPSNTPSNAMPSTRPGLAARQDQADPATYPHRANAPAIAGAEANASSGSTRHLAPAAAGAATTTTTTSNAVPSSGDARNPERPRHAPAHVSAEANGPARRAQAAASPRHGARDGERTRPATNPGAGTLARRSSGSVAGRDATRTTAPAAEFEVRGYANLANALQRGATVPGNSLPPVRATTHAAEQAPTPGTGTEWADRISQRRITDVPEQFSK